MPSERPGRRGARLARRRRGADGVIGAGPCAGVDLEAIAEDDAGLEPPDGSILGPPR